MEKKVIIHFDIWLDLEDTIYMDDPSEEDVIILTGEERKRVISLIREALRKQTNYEVKVY